MIAIENIRLKDKRLKKLSKEIKITKIFFLQLAKICVKCTSKERRKEY